MGDAEPCGGLHQPARTPTHAPLQHTCMDRCPKPPSHARARPPPCRAAFMVALSLAFDDPGRPTSVSWLNIVNLVGSILYVIDVGMGFHVGLIVRWDSRAFILRGERRPLRRPPGRTRTRAVGCLRRRRRVRGTGGVCVCGGVWVCVWGGGGVGGSTRPGPTSTPLPASTPAAARRAHRGAALPVAWLHLGPAGLCARRATALHDCL